MEFQILTCRHCVGPETFETANELAAHHFDYHHRPEPGAIITEEGTIGMAGPWPRRLWVDVRTLTLPPKNGATNTVRPGAH